MKGQRNGLQLADLPEIDLLREADERARTYAATIGSRRAWPDPEALEALVAFQEDLRNTGEPMSRHCGCWTKSVLPQLRRPQGRTILAM
jgi:hypothetical protein